MMTRVHLKHCKNPSHYYTDLNKVRSVINAWAKGVLMQPPHAPRPEHMQPHPDHERIQSRPDGYRLWLLSNWIQIGMNIDGALIIVDYTFDYLTKHYYDPASPMLEEIVNHVQITKEMVPSAAVWSPEAWTMFPLTDAPGDLQLPF